MKKAVVCLVACAALTACVETAPEKPIVSGFTGASVQLQGFGMYAGKPPAPQFVAEAKRLCQTRGNQAEYASTRQIDQWTVEYLFICL